MQTIRFDLFDENRYFMDPPEPQENQSLPAITAQDALSDLPRIHDASAQKLGKGPRRFDTLVPYPAKDSLTPYQTMMRKWSGFEAGEGIRDHVIRYLPRDYKIFARLAPGDQYPQAHALAVRMFEERLAEIEKLEGKRPEKRTERYEKEEKAYIPPYDPHKFPNKWRKMEADQPARTLMAHLGKDGYSHIHYDSSQARTISVREAARLQSFQMDSFLRTDESSLQTDRKCCPPADGQGIG
jgi:DNA (cytosine-5)-methyltransferase 1